MKVRNLKIENFKGIKDLEVSFSDQHSSSIRPLTAVLGDNGSGKTSLLQAIALPISMATRRTRDMASFDWYGFLPERISSLGETSIELDISFEEEELELTHKLFEAWKDSLSPEQLNDMAIVPPSRYKEVTLQLAKGRLSSPQGWDATLQFLGRYYVKSLKNSRPDLRPNFAMLGDVFWFDQFRNLGSVMTHDDGENSCRSWQAGVEQLREYLIGWWGHHRSENMRGKDYIEPLETLFQSLFPRSKFVGIEPKNDVESPKAGDFYFLIERDDRIYDLSEMSSGEQSVFPLIYEFVRLDIKKSIVLIDELELHLHPSEQQKFLFSLSKLGPDCQFIITTHSQYLSEVIPSEHEIRMGRGSLCL